MAAGSAFDAYVKSYLAESLFGNAVPDELQRDYMLEVQVEQQWRDWGVKHGKLIFEQYLFSGALAGLLAEMANAADEPRFESTVQAHIKHEKNIIGLTFLGKPDLYFITRDGAHVVDDWKVNGYCAKNAVSPKKGYVVCRDGWDSSTAKPSRNKNRPHKDAIIEVVNGISINAACPLEKIDEDWATQLAIYGWVLGEPVGSDFIVGIEQLVAKPHNDSKLIRVASHRARISPEFQLQVFERALHAWNCIKKGHIFEDMSLEDNNKKCSMLDEQHLAFAGDPEDPNEAWFQEQAGR